MLKNSNSIIELKINELFNGSSQYIIPVYQRNYAWGHKEISQLVQDICNVIEDGKQEEKQSNYYIGTLVTYKRTDGKYEVIDGQQRLTTLTLLMYALSHSDLIESESFKIKNNLEFECRQDSNSLLQILQQISNNNISLPCIDNTGLLKGYEICKKEINKLKSNNVEHNTSIHEFVKYLLNNVKIIRIEVPEDTDLNHYFEIMNNRGEQLEKHEIIKNRLYSKLSNSKDRHVFHLIWEACANMDQYVQKGFESSDRLHIFDIDLQNFKIKSFDNIVISKFDNKILEATKNNIANIIRSKDDYNKNTKKINDDDYDSKYEAIIDFPHFLLQALQLFVNDDFFTGELQEQNKKISLDDKLLLNQFDKIFKDQDFTEGTVKQFSFELLRYKFLLDCYIIKRISQKEDWCIKYLKSSDKSQYDVDLGESKELNMLQAMFHVSYPSQSSQHWLTAALKILSEDDKYLLVSSNNSSDFYNSLLAVAKRFLTEKYLYNKPKDYSHIIFNIDNNSNNECDYSKLRYGNVSTFVFNYLDYLLFKMYQSKGEFLEAYKNRIGYDYINNFKFTFRSSVEHFWSQNDENGKKLSNDKDEHERLLHSFGNLCLVTHEQNSSLGNQDPDKKKIDVQNKIERFKRVDNIKQWIMLQDLENKKEWNKTTINDHEQNMIDILQNDLEKHKNEN